MDIVRQCEKGIRRRVKLKDGRAWTSDSAECEYSSACIVFIKVFTGSLLVEA